MMMENVGLRSGKSKKAPRHLILSITKTRQLHCPIAFGNLKIPYTGHVYSGIASYLLLFRSFNQLRMYVAATRIKMMNSKIPKMIPIVAPSLIMLTWPAVDDEVGVS